MKPPSILMVSLAAAAMSSSEAPTRTMFWLKTLAVVPMQPSLIPKPLTKATPTSPVPMMRSIMQILLIPFSGSAWT